MEKSQQSIVRIFKDSPQSRRYDIELSTGRVISIHEDVLVAFGLHKGMTIETDQWQHWLEEDERVKIRQTAYRYLSYRPRTSAEVTQYLCKHEWQEGLVEQVVEELSSSRYIDDRAYAVEWVRQRQQNKGIGMKRLRQELIQKGVALHWIEEALLHIDEDQERQQAMTIAERRYLRICHERWDKIERRIGSYLIRRGYSTQIVYPILSELRNRHRGG
ncbi:regulatory protein [Seinonella peptonophila]|uniref:Regulatory protein RecX n=1 Tax=Seinonella peptonophila TaxID=112248 RepID=A0A1M4TAF7_9BACL|nr:RecX family transcriptional regulator [Seinonella peptonophila]SHE41451.1 regulatory protein [Seinonella peptonophila]